MKIFIVIALAALITFSKGYSQDIWERTDGLDSMTIYSLALNSSGDIFAGTHMNGVFRSTDNGDNWSNLGIINYDIHSIAISSNGDIYAAAFLWGGILRSTDNGNNWINLGLYHFDYSIAINSNGDIFVGTGAVGIWRTTDNGENWVQILFGSNCSGINSLIINSSGDIFAGTIQGGVFRSTDNGENWIQIIQGMTELNILSLAINSSGDIFAGSSGGGVFRSTNNGVNWVQINQGLTSQGSYIRSLVINTNGNIFAGTADGTFRTTDNGANWVQINQGLNNNDVFSLAVNTSGDIFAGTADGIFRNISTTSFQLTVNLTNGWNMVSIPGLHPSNQIVTTWWPDKDPAAGVFNFQGGYQPVTVAAPGVGYWMKNVGAQTYNTGDEWPIGGINFAAHDPVAAAPGWNLFGGYEESAAASELTTTPPGLITGSVYEYSGGYTIASTLNPGYGYWVKLTGAGSINIPSAQGGPVVKSVAGPSTEGFGKIIITDNQMKTYTLYAVNGEADLTQFDIPPYPPQGMFDVRYSSQRCAENLSTQQGIEMTGVQYPVKLKAEGTGIILSDETGKEVARLKAGEEVTLNTAVNKLMVSANVIPSLYSLEQNYPNPFNPGTTIQFNIPEDVQNVKLIIYDVLGEKAAELVNTGLQAGYYKYSWNAGSFASGVYIYKLITEKFVSTKKMILMK